MMLMTRREMIYALGALCLLLLGVIVIELVAGGVPTVAVVAPPLKRLPPPPAPIKPPPPIETFAEVWGRPLFSPTRQPSPQEASDFVGNVTGFFVTSIIIDGGQRVALVQHGRPPEVARLSEGQELEGWMVRSIESERVMFERGGVRQELKLKDRPPARHPPGPQAAPEPLPPPQPGQLPEHPRGPR